MENLDLLNADGLDDGFLSNSEKIGFKLFKSSKPIDFEVNKSNVHGLGLFAVNPIKKGTILIPIMQIDVDGKIINEYDLKFEPQNYLNHSESNNTIPFKVKDIIYIAALKDIPSNDEILCNYNNFKKLGVTNEFFGFKEISDEYSKEYFDAIFELIRKNNPQMNRPIGYRYSI